MNYLSYIQSLINRGVWSFTSEEFGEHLGFSPKDRLSSLSRSGRVITPARGFHVIVPEEYVNSGRLPVERYIDALMRYYSRPYYVGLLTAASYWGSAHQSPQVFQVITNYDRRNILINRNKIVFYEKKNVETIPIAMRKSVTGYFNISTPESTFFDLVYFNKQVGGLENVGLILSELSEQMKTEALHKAINNYPNANIQRGAYLMELLGLEKFCSILDKYLRKENIIYTYLNPSGSIERANKHKRWKLLINETLELDI